MKKLLLLAALALASPAAAQAPMPAPSRPFPNSGVWAVDVQALALSPDNSRVAYTVLFNRTFVDGSRRNSRSSGLLTDGGNYYYAYGSVQFAEPCTGPNSLVQDIVVRLNKLNPTVQDIAWYPRIATRMAAGKALNFQIKVPKGYHYQDGSAAILDPYNHQPMLASVEPWPAPPVVTPVSGDPMSTSTLTLKVSDTFVKVSGVAPSNEAHLVQFTLVSDAPSPMPMPAPGPMPMPMLRKPRAIAPDPSKAIRGVTSGNNPLYPAPVGE